MRKSGRPRSNVSIAIRPGLHSIAVPIPKHPTTVIDTRSSWIRPAQNATALSQALPVLTRIFPEPISSSTFAAPVPIASIDTTYVFIPIRQSYWCSSINLHVYPELHDI